MRLILTFGILILMSGLSPAQSLKDQQSAYARVAQALQKKEASLLQNLERVGIRWEQGFDIYFRAFKKEAVMEVWVKNKGESAYTLLTQWAFCSSVGFLGPKTEQGDRQIPEGFYRISELNPLSDYHLSLKINYPNLADSIRSKGKNPGGQIYVHGGCETVGCIPLSDSIIEDAYLLCVLAASGQSGLPEIPVHIFPTHLQPDNFKSIASAYNNNSLNKFWGNLRTCYVYFESYRKLPMISVDPGGWYLFQPVN